MEPGFFKAKPISWKADLNQNGKPFVNVKFNNGLYWRGWLVGNAIQYTVDSLALMGFKGRNAQELNTNPNALNKDKEVDIKVDFIKNADGSFYIKNGQKQLEVTGVWPPYQQKEVSQEAAMELKSIDLRAYLQSGGQSKKGQDQGSMYDDAFTTDDIPF